MNTVKFVPRAGEMGEIRLQARNITVDLVKSQLNIIRELGEISFRGNVFRQAC